MRRVITVNLGGNAFQLDEDAYERLRAYVSLTQSRLGTNPDRAEISADLERAVAEHIVANRGPTSGVVVSDAEMDQALVKVGNVERSEAASPGVGSSATPASYAPGWDRGAESDYTRLPVVLLCFFLGVFGVHRFFVGKIGTGVLMLLTFGGLTIWWLIDMILILCGEFRDRDDRRVLRWA